MDCASRSFISSRRLVGSRVLQTRCLHPHVLLLLLFVVSNSVVSHPTLDFHLSVHPHSPSPDSLLLAQLLLLLRQLAISTPPLRTISTRTRPLVSSRLRDRRMPRRERISNRLSLTLFGTNVFTSSVASPPGEGFWWSQTHSQLANSLWGGYTYKHLVVYLRWARPGSAAVDSVLFIKSISLASSPSFLECACAIESD